MAGTSGDNGGNAIIERSIPGGGALQALAPVIAANAGQMTVQEMVAPFGHAHGLTRRDKPKTGRVCGFGRSEGEICTNVRRLSHVLASCSSGYTAPVALKRWWAAMVG